MATKKADPKKSLAIPLLVVAVLVVSTAGWFGFPAMALLWLSLLVISLVEPKVVATGQSVKGERQPISDREARDIATSTYWRGMRARLLVPLDLVRPGWPVAATWILALVAALLTWSMPVLPSFIDGLLSQREARTVDSISVILRIENTFCAAWLVGALTAGRRKIKGSRGVRINTLKRVFTAGPDAELTGLTSQSSSAIQTKRVLALFGGATLGSVLAFAASSVFEWVGKTTVLGLVLAGGIGGIWYWWDRASLHNWRTIKKVSDQWNDWWTGAKIDPVPQLESVKDVADGLRVLTWRAQGSKSGQDLVDTVPKMLHHLGTGTKASALYAPVVTGEGPQYGTNDPQRARVVLWTEEDRQPTAEANADDDDALWLAVECAMSDGCNAAKVGHLALTECEKITTDESPAPAWGTSWQPLSDDAPSLQAARNNGSIRIGVAKDLGVDVLVDHKKTNAIFLGALLDENTEFSDDGMAAMLSNLDTEDLWKKRWSAGGPASQKENTPTWQAGQHKEATLANGATIYREVFLLKHGQTYTEFSNPKQDEQMATALNSAAMFATAGFDGRSGRSGDRLAAGLTVYHAAHGTKVPPTMDQVPPSKPQPTTMSAVNPAGWVITWMINKAFAASKLARGEVVQVKCLTKPEAPKHLWEVEIRLHSGVTLSAVRKVTETIRGTLGVPWLRMAPAPDGVVMYAGVKPDMDTVKHLSGGESELVRMVGLDWEEAFRSSNCIATETGETPTLEDIQVSPTNEKITTLNFSIPGGLSIKRINGALEKLRTITHNDFIMVRKSDRGAGWIDLVVSASNPMPSTINFDVEKAKATPGSIFASNIENAPVPLGLGDENPHLSFFGLSGGGKSVAAQAALSSELLRGSQLVIIDPQKKAADFTFLREWTIGWADTYEDAAAAVNALYAEMNRRIELYRDYGVGGIKDMPEDVRPPKIVAFIDEFIGLIGKETNTYDKNSSDPEIVKAYQEVEFTNALRMSIGGRIAKLLGEARSAGIHLILASQTLKADTLKKIPGGDNVKTQLARLLIGKANHGEKASALRSPEKCEPDGDTVPPGRALFESTTSNGAILIQIWFGKQDFYRAALTEHVAQRPDLALDLDAHRPQREASGDIADNIAAAIQAAGVQDQDQSDVVREVTVDADDFDLDLGDDEVATADADDLVLDLGDDGDESSDDLVLDLDENDLAALDEDLSVASEPEQPEPTSESKPEPEYYVPAKVVSEEW